MRLYRALCDWTHHHGLCNFVCRLSQTDCRLASSRRSMDARVSTCFPAHQEGLFPLSGPSCHCSSNNCVVRGLTPRASAPFLPLEPRNAPSCRSRSNAVHRVPRLDQVCTKLCKPLSLRSISSDIRYIVLGTGRRPFVHGDEAAQAAHPNRAILAYTASVVHGFPVSS